MRAAALVVVASALVACNASLDLGGNDDPGTGGGGGEPAVGSTTASGDDATASTSASSAGGDAGGGGSASSTGGGGPGGGGDGPLEACAVPDGAVVPEPIFEASATVTNAFAVGDARVAISVENEEGPWPTLIRLDRGTMTPLDDGIDLDVRHLAFAGDMLLGADFCGPWRESGDLAVPLIPSCTDELVYSVASDGTTVVFGEMDRLWSAPADGSGAPTLLFELGQPGVTDAIFYDVVLDGPVAYVVAPAFSDSGGAGGHGTVWRIALDGSFRQLLGETPTTFSPADPKVGPTRVVVGDGHVYWNDTAQGQVYRADEDFGEPELVFDVEAAAVDIALVGDDLIVAEAPGACRGTILHRLAGGTGEPTTFAVVDERVTVEGSSGELFLTSTWNQEPTGARIYRLTP